MPTRVSAQNLRILGSTARIRRVNQPIEANFFAGGGVAAVSTASGHPNSSTQQQYAKACPLQSVVHKLSAELRLFASVKCVQVSDTRLFEVPSRACTHCVQRKFLCLLQGVWAGYAVDYAGGKQLCTSAPWSLPHSLNTQRIGQRVSIAAYCFRSRVRAASPLRVNC